MAAPGGAAAATFEAVAASGVATAAVESQVVGAAAWVVHLQGACMTVQFHDSQGSTCTSHAAQPACWREGVMAEAHKHVRGHINSQGPN